MECTMCEDYVCDPGGTRWLVDLGGGHGPKPYGEVCASIARRLASGRDLSEALDDAGLDVVARWDTVDELTARRRRRSD